ncbi:MAG TPA: MMPL family transporter [Gaiellaceae bacterium]|nr:MMPL family transporter [Gaiellaceae bacterium]
MSDLPHELEPSWRARLLVALRVPILLGWIVAAVAASVYLPSLAEAESASVGGLVASDAEAVQVEERDFELFRFPLLSRTAVVQRDPEGLGPREFARAVARAQEINEGRIPLLRTIEFALPIANTGRLFPSSRESSTTALTYLYFKPEATLNARTSLGRTYATRIAEDGDPVVGVTGAIPARLAEWHTIEEALPRVEILTVAFIALLIGFTFRSLGAPLVVLGAAGVAYLVALRLAAWMGTALEVSVPREVEPVMLVLLLGVVTDYAVFYLASFRRELGRGCGRLEAARCATAINSGVVATAGLIVALGSAALVVGRLEFFRALGPASGMTILVALLVCLTFVPAALALFGGLVFRNVEPEPDYQPRGLLESVRALAGRAVTSRAGAALGVVVASAVLVVAALPALDLRLGFTLIRSLPEGHEVDRAAKAAAAGFAPGILSPTLVLVEGTRLDRQREALIRLQRLLERQPGVAGVVGPRQLPESVQVEAFVAEDGRAARYAVILERDPLSAPAIDDFRALAEAGPRLVREAGLLGAQIGFAGDTSLASETVERMVDDTGRIAVAALLVNFLLLALFLRALVAPLYLLAASALALGAALGLTTFVFGEHLGNADVTYYVPFAAAVLLLSLGSDYNVFVVGRIWAAARTRSVRDAVSFAVPRASRVVSIAALALAGSFAALALVPLRPFRELAFVMAVGILLDAFVVRTILVPALVLLFGERSWWPARRPLQDVPAEAPAAETAATPEGERG